MRSAADGEGRGGAPLSQHRKHSSHPDCMNKRAEEETSVSFSIFWPWQSRVTPPHLENSSNTKGSNVNMKNVRDHSGCAVSRLYRNCHHKEIHPFIGPSERNVTQWENKKNTNHTCSSMKLSQRRIPLKNANFYKVMTKWWDIMSKKSVILWYTSAVSLGRSSKSLVFSWRSSKIRWNNHLDTLQTITTTQKRWVNEVTNKTHRRLTELSLVWVQRFSDDQIMGCGWRKGLKQHKWWIKLHKGRDEWQLCPLESETWMIGGSHLCPSGISHLCFSVNYLWLFNNSSWCQSNKGP